MVAAEKAERGLLGSMMAAACLVIACLVGLAGYCGYWATAAQRATSVLLLVQGVIHSALQPWY